MVAMSDHDAEPQGDPATPEPTPAPAEPLPSAPDPLIVRDIELTDPVLPIRVETDENPSG